MITDYVTNLWNFDYQNVFPLHFIKESFCTELTNSGVCVNTSKMSNLKIVILVSGFWVGSSGLGDGHFQNVENFTNNPNADNKTEPTVFPSRKESPISPDGHDHRRFSNLSLNTVSRFLGYTDIPHRENMRCVIVKYGQVEGRKKSDHFNDFCVTNFLISKTVHWLTGHRPLTQHLTVQVL